MPDNPRIEELRRRVQKDPSSIAFAQLGEEYRRAGNFEDAIKTCRAGLARHPSYLSARVTLGRALIETNQLDAAETELTHVLKAAPENLAAIRGLADIQHRRGHLEQALTFYRRALSLAQNDPDLEQTVDDIERTIEPVSGPAEVPGGLSFAQAREELMSLMPQAPPPSNRTEAATMAGTDAERGRGPSAAAESGTPRGQSSEEPAVPHPEAHAIPALEAFLATIATYRRRSGSS